MRTPAILLLLASLATAFVVPGQTSGSQDVNVLGGPPQSPNTRHTPGTPAVFPYIRGRALTDLLSPAREMVEVILRREGGMRLRAPEGMSEIEFKVRQADVVAIVTAEEISAELSPRADWVFSTVTARLLDLLKSTDSIGASLEGSQISFRISGGVLMLGSNQILATIEGVQRLTEGETYLIAFELLPNGTLFAGSTEFLFRVQSDRFWPLDAESRLSNLPHANRADVEQAIRDASVLPSLKSRRVGGR